MLSDTYSDYYDVYIPEDGIDYSGYRDKIIINNNGYGYSPIYNMP